MVSFPLKHWLTRLTPCVLYRMGLEESLLICFCHNYTLRVGRPAPRKVALVFSHAGRTQNGCKSFPACALGYSAVLLLDGSAYDLLELLCNAFANHPRGLSIWRTACFVALLLWAGSRLSPAETSLSPPASEPCAQADRSLSV
jgi:hypothetical protein